MIKQKAAGAPTGYSAVVKRLREKDMEMRRLHLQVQHVFGAHAYKLLQSDKNGTGDLDSLAHDLRILPEVLRASIRFWKLVDRPKLKQICALDVPPKWIAMSRWSFIHDQPRRNAIMDKLLSGAVTGDSVYRAIVDTRKLDEDAFIEAAGNNELDADLIGLAEPNYVSVGCHYRWIVVQEPGKPEVRYEVGQDDVEEIYSHIDEFGCCCGPGGLEIHWFVVCYEPQSPGDDLPPQTHIDGRFCEKSKAIELEVAIQLVERVRTKRHHRRNRVDPWEA